MDSLTDSSTLAQVQNLDPASKLEIQQVIEEETRKAALQASPFPRFPFPFSQLIFSGIHKHADM
jgi:hypothetical protein